MEPRNNALKDPLLHEIELPRRITCYPLGFHLEVSSNSRHVIEAAGEAWGIYAPAFSRPPLEVRVIVQREGGLAGEPVFRGQGQLFSMVYDRHNYGVYESNRMAGYCFVSEKTASDHALLRAHFLEAMVYSMLAQRHAVPMHAAAVMREGSGVLLCGRSGAGKSTLAFGCARAGWTFVSDDATWLPAGVESRVAIGKPQQVRFRADAPRLFPELARYAAGERPNGKISIEAGTSDFGGIRTSVSCPVDHVVMLERREGAPERLSRISPETAIESLNADLPSFGEAIGELHQSTLNRLLDASAWRLEYRGLDGALECLAALAGER